MTVENPALFLPGQTHPGRDVRRLLLGFLAGDTEGVIDGLAVSEKGTPDMSVDVAAGRVIVVGDEASNQGVYFCESGSTENLTISAAPGGGDSRIDLVVARVRDSDYASGSPSTNAWALEIVEGTAAASPSEPAVPDNAVVLARVDIGSSTSSITNSEITDRRTFHPGVAHETDIQIFTADGTWTKPTGAKTVTVEMVAGGGGGGAGERGLAGANRRGGSGGQAGGYARGVFRASDLASSVAVTVGQGGAGGASSTSNSVGADGANGEDSTFGTLLYAKGGDQGVGGDAAASQEGGRRFGAGGRGGTGSANGVGNDGAPAGIEFTTPVGTGTGAHPAAGGGGGGGGGIDTSNNDYNGGRGGAESILAGGADTVGAGGTFGAANGGNGGAGTSVTANTAFGGAGGGGGGSNHDGDAGDGANGGLYGGGGGGGGATQTGADRRSGGGGNGADGIVIVVTHR